MTDSAKQLFQLKNIPLPEAALRLPLRPAPGSAHAGSEAGTPPEALAALLEPLISAAIARKARQRRYTP